METNQILKILIEKSGLTKSQFAEKHGYKTYRVYDWTTGKRNISLKNLGLIAFNEGYKINVKISYEKF